MVTIPRPNTSSVTCSNNDISATFYRFNMSVYDRTFNSTQDNLHVCVVRTPPHPQLPENLMLQDPAGKLYTTSTMQNRGDEMTIWGPHNGEFSVSLRFSKESFEGMEVNSTATWYCVLWDPILNEVVERSGFEIHRGPGSDNTMIYKIVGSAGGLVLVLVIALGIWLKFKHSRG
eukprot:sb/3472051/